MTVTALRSLCAFILAAAPVTAIAGMTTYGPPPSPYGQVGNPYLVQPAPAPMAAPVRMSLPAPVVQRPLPAPVQAAPVQAAPAPRPMVQPIAAADGYQVPATSKYAARINAAHAALAAQSVAAIDASQPAAAPQPASSDDHVFVPGEHYTDPSQEPRLYSLHRQWGLTPDAITVDHSATGALLTLSDLPDAAGKDQDNDPTDDDGAEAPASAKTATP